MPKFDFTTWNSIKFWFRNCKNVCQNVIFVSSTGIFINVVRSTAVQQTTPVLKFDGSLAQFHTPLCQMYRPLCLFHGPINRIIIKRPCVNLAESFRVALGWFHGPLSNFINPRSISWTNWLISKTRPLASSPANSTIITICIYLNHIFFWYYLYWCRPN